MSARWNLGVTLVFGFLVLWTNPNYAEDSGKPLEGKEGQPPKALPDDLNKAWREAGVKVGWIGVDESGFFYFQMEAEGKSGEKPAFRLRPWKPGLLAKLPMPSEGFGLDLGFTKVTDADLKELAALKQLRTLKLSSTKVTDVTLKELATLKQLEMLDLGNTKVTDTGLKELASLKQLQVLNLGFTKVTDKGMKELVTLKHLQSLYLWNTAVTDAGLKELSTFKQLQWLYLKDTQVTDAGIDELQKTIPGLHVNR